MASVTSAFDAQVVIYAWGPLVASDPTIDWIDDFLDDLDEIEIRVWLDQTSPESDPHPPNSYDYDGVGTQGFVTYENIPARVRPLYRRDTSSKDGHWIAETIQVHLPKRYGLNENSTIIWDGFQYNVLKVQHIEAFALDKVMALRERKES